MADSTEAVAVLTKHLKTLPIYPIYENCAEKDNFTALQFMCIVSFHAYGINLYERIKDVQQPKLLGQLLQFRQFEKFKYFHYSVAKQYGNYVLQCKYCPLVGPCGCILSHMAVNHNVHASLKICVFCNRETWEAHNGNSSLLQCYKHYIKRNVIQIDVKVCEIVALFYEMMRKLSGTLNICLVRRKGYAGQGYKRKELLRKDYGGDILRECEVRYMIPKTQNNRTIRSETLDREFQRIMVILFGGFFPSFSKNSELRVASENVIEVDGSSSDEEVNNITTGNGPGHQDARTLSNNDMMPENLVKREPSDSPAPSTIIFPMASASTSTPIMERRSNRLSTFSSVSRPSSDWTPTNENEDFALNIARKLDKIPLSKRRQLEIDIEMKILQTETEAIQEGCYE